MIGHVSKEVPTCFKLNIILVKKMDTAKQKKICLKACDRLENQCGMGFFQVFFLSFFFFLNDDNQSIVIMYVYL